MFSKHNISSTTADLLEKNPRIMYLQLIFPCYSSLNKAIGSVGESKDIVPVLFKKSSADMATKWGLLSYIYILLLIDMLQT